MFGKTDDLIIILLIVLVLFGAKRLPEDRRVDGACFGDGEGGKMSHVGYHNYHRIFRFCEQ